MKQITQPFLIPADVPLAVRGEYSDNYSALTRGTDRLFLFVCDHHIEHGFSDFHGTNIAADAADPEYIFKIAAQGFVGALATHPGLIARYAHLYDDIAYVAKLTAKTSFIAADQKDPLSAPLLSVEQVIAFKEESELDICGIGVTLYPGSEYEDEMLTYASNAVYTAHQHGLVAIVWVYPRGHAVAHGVTFESLATGVGIATSLGADFVKIPLLEKDAYKNPDIFASLAHAGGNTKIICAGGEYNTDAKDLLQRTYMYIHEAKLAGIAMGRNIFQRPIGQAVALTQALEALIYEDSSFEQAYALYTTHEREKTSL